MIPLKKEFNGTWRFVNEKEAEGWNYLHFSNGNRIIQFYNIKEGSFEDGRMLVSQISDEKIEFFPKGGGEGWTRGFRFDDGNLVIVEGDDEYPCQRLPETPDWLSDGIGIANQFFDEHEAAWDDKE